MNAPFRLAEGRVFIRRCDFHTGAEFCRSRMDSFYGVNGGSDENTRRSQGADNRIRIQETRQFFLENRKRLLQADKFPDGRLRRLLFHKRSAASRRYAGAFAALRAGEKSKRKPMRTALARRADCGGRESVWMENRILLKRLRCSGPSCSGHVGDRILAERVERVRNYSLRQFRRAIAFIFHRSDTLAQAIPAAEKLLRL